MSVSLPRTGGIAVIRMLIAHGPTPIIRILEVRSTFGQDCVLLVTTSPDEALEVIRTWMNDALSRADDHPADA